jgi:hypothetical protein
VSSRNQRLDTLTRRWRERHDARRPAASARPPADPVRETQARQHFPYRKVTPAGYVEDHGDDMAGFTYDEVTYTDGKLDAWLQEVGQLLRERREAAEASEAAEAAKAAKAAKGAEGVGGDSEPGDG